MELIGLYLIGCALLFVAGSAKTVRPDSTSRVLGPLLPSRVARTLPLRRLRWAVRAGAAGEALVGLTALVVPRPLTAALVALSYFGFAAFVVHALSRGGPLASCGCFGKPDTPATSMHVAVDVALAVAALLVAAQAPATGSLLTVLGHQPLGGLPLVAVSAVGLWLTYLVLAILPDLEGRRRQLVGRR